MSNSTPRMSLDEARRILASSEHYAAETIRVAMSLVLVANMLAGPELGPEQLVDNESHDD